MSAVLRLITSACLSLIIVACGGGGGDGDDNDGSNNNGGGGQQQDQLTTPTGLSANGEIGHIGLSWTFVSVASSYRVYYSTTSPVSKTDDYFSVQGPSYSHNELTAGDTFYYAVSAIQNSEESDLSSEVSATVQAPAQPPQATAQVLVEGSDASLKVSWPEVSGADSYHILYNDGVNADITIEGATSPHTISSLTNGTEYSIVVRSVNGDGTADSEAVSGIADIRSTIQHHAPRITGVAFGNSKHILVGDGGAIYSASSDGTNLTALDSDTKYNLSSVAYGASKFVAVGEGSVITTSSDGITWTSKFSPTGGGINKIIFANNMFYGAAQYSMVTSSDGNTWQVKDHSTTQCTEGPENDHYLEHVAYGSNLLVVGAETGCIKLSSDNGDTWSSNNIGASETESLVDLIYDGSKFVAITLDNGPVYYLQTSTDGETWTKNQVSDADVETIQGFAFDGSVYVTSSNGGSGLRYLTSSDGLVWDVATINSGDMGFAQVIHNGTDFVAVGDNLQMSMSTDSGATWDSKTTSVVTADFMKILHDGGQYLAISSQGGVYTSSDLTSWTLQTSFALSNGYINDVEVVGNVITAAGHVGFSNTAAIVISHSFTNGADYSTGWTTADASNSGGVNALAHDGSRYLAATRITIGYSGNNPWDNIANQPVNVPYTDIETDGTNIVVLTNSGAYHHLVSSVTDWVTATSLSLGVTQITHHNSTFYGFSSSKIISSSDGLSWSDVNINSPLSTSGIFVHDGTQFISAVGGDSLVTSTDFITEVLRGGNQIANHGQVQIRDVLLHDGNNIVVVGNDGYVAIHPGYD
jgi:photosystem II stability/assembly factor-like uncharacterized protein